ncbi:MAG: peptidoglycan-binding protein LysM [Candidatus Thiodiazotropha sp. (ex. Lucinisca nassula)]|nr:peptidoglycan-binding protein LysM [Candidatus Thiodiazotropha sp. (ex. Lucinisca nassula)]MBW9274872.1 peptidoglycan-binding protein LysM [Candidatus Thiodiazotropha sp. (ex. Lucinisca nassula)]PUB85364.1 MAG: peptidoglycan-binding protein LysM [gamma proteobacterium symbiont of Ctena orbiculata]
MGLFDFAANLGKKLFGKDDDPAEKIKQQIEADNPGIKDLDVSFDDGKVVLSGNAESAEALEKTVLIAGNVQGVSEVTADAVTAPQQQAKIEYYTIESGDTLSAIAKRFLGKASDYPKIFEANREVIKDPNLIYPGQKIRIPLD